MENRSHRSSYLLDHPGLTVHGQDVLELCQSLWLPGGPGTQGQSVQLPIC